MSYSVYCACVDFSCKSFSSESHKVRVLCDGVSSPLLLCDAIILHIIIRYAKCEPHTNNNNNNIIQELFKVINIWNMFLYKQPTSVEFFDLAFSFSQRCCCCVEIIDVIVCERLKIVSRTPTHNKQCT